MLVLLIGAVEGTPESAYYLQDKPFCPPVHPDDPSTNSDPNILPDLASTSTVNSSGLYEMPSLLMTADLLVVSALGGGCHACLPCFAAFSPLQTGTHGGVPSMMIWEKDPRGERFPASSNYVWLVKD